MDETFVFADDDVGVRFTIESRFVAGPKVAPSEIFLGRVASAYLAAVEDDDRTAILSLSSVEVDYEMTRAQLDEAVAGVVAYTAGLAEQRGWTIYRPHEACEVAGHLAMRNEFAAKGGIDENGEPADEETHPAGHIQSCTVYLEGRNLSIMLGVHPPGDLDRARRSMEQVLATLEILPQAPPAGAAG
jgi:hypothetical protein